MSIASSVLLSVGLILGLTSTCLAADWKQWRGPQRNSVSAEQGLRQEWVSSPPRLAWSAAGLGDGYASVVVSAGRVYTIGRVAGRLLCTSLEESTGKRIWQRQVGTTKRIPMSTPTIGEGVLFVLDPDGELSCLDLHNGNLRWSRSYLDDFSGIMMSGRGYGESPLLDEGRLICTPGSPSATLVALKPETGELIWKAALPVLGKAGRDGAGFSSPVKSHAAGVAQYVQLVGRGVIGVRASDGRFLWGYNEIANQTANIPTPLVEGDWVFAANGYNAGSVLLQLGPTAEGVAAKRVYSLSGGRFQNHHGGVTLIDGHIYGGHGSNNGLPTCLEMETGKIRWKRRGPGVGSASVIYADNRLYFRYQNGVVALIEVSPRGFKLRGTFQIPGAGGDSWSHPVVANGRLLLREKGTLFAYDVRDLENGRANDTSDGSVTQREARDYSPVFEYLPADPSPHWESITERDVAREGDLTPAALERLARTERPLVVDAAGTPLGDAALGQLAGLPRLIGINLESCLAVSDAGLVLLAQAKGLRVISLLGTKVTDSGIQPLAELSNLVGLDLEVCDNLADGACDALGKMTSLRCLILKKTGFEPQRFSAKGLAQLGRLSALEHLNLYGNLVGDETLDHLTSLTSLQTLDLSRTSITDQGLERLLQLRQLRRLDLVFSEGFAGPKVTDRGVRMLARFPQLQHLSLIGAPITERAVLELKVCAGLRTLNLVNTGVGPDTLRQLEMALPDCRIVR